MNTALRPTPRGKVKFYLPCLAARLQIGTPSASRTQLAVKVAAKPTAPNRYVCAHSVRAPRKQSVSENSTTDRRALAVLRRMIDGDVLGRRKVGDEVARARRIEPRCPPVMRDRSRVMIGHNVPRRSRCHLGIGRHGRRGQKRSSRHCRNRKNLLHCFLHGPSQAAT